MMSLIVSAIPAFIGRRILATGFALILALMLAGMPVLLVIDTCIAGIVQWYLLSILGIFGRHGSAA